MSLRHRSEEGVQGPGFPPIREGINSRPPSRSHPHAKMCLVLSLSCLPLSCPVLPCLDLSCPVLARFSLPTWPQLGSQDGAKIGKKSMQKSIIFLMPLGIDFWMDLGGFWVPKWRQVGTKMGSKNDINFEGRKPTKR